MLIPSFSSIYIDILETKEVVFTLVTNTKSKEKAKVSFLSPTNSKSKILLVSRTSPLFKTAAASLASKLAVTHLVSATAATSTQEYISNSSNLQSVVFLSYFTV